MCNDTSIEALKTLLDHYWREWQDKVKYQWKFSFSIWGAILSAVSASFLKKTSMSVNGLLILILTVIITHAMFVIWIKIRLKSIRGESQQIIEKLREISTVPPINKAKYSFGRLWIAEFTQVLITLILCFILIYAAVR